MILHPSLKSQFITKENRTILCTLVFFSSLSLNCNQSSQIVPWAAPLMCPAQHPTCPQQHHHSAPVHSLTFLPNPSHSSPSRQNPATPSVHPCMPSWGYLVHILHVSSPQLLLVWLGTESTLFRQHWRTGQALAASEQAMTQFFLYFFQFNSLLSYSSSQNIWKCNFYPILPKVPDDITGKDILVSNVSLWSETRLMRWGSWGLNTC